ncbi:MAG: putative endonuclease [Candidatus Marinamargulisbacteria bacterium]|jgi:putative endonuclease
MASWSLYLIRTKGGSLYTGITQDVSRRFLVHQSNSKESAKYLRGKGPLKLVFQKEIGTRSEALKMEISVKRLSKSEKEALVRGTRELPDKKIEI